MQYAFALIQGAFTTKTAELDNEIQKLRQSLLDRDTQAALNTNRR